MTPVRISLGTAAIAAVTLMICNCKSEIPPPPENEEAPFDLAGLPQPQREFRAAWIATVGNIDWPSRPALSMPAQKKEAIAILDRIVELNMNAVILQVRPQADALYKSSLEPWSSYLTGIQGRAPDPFYDPLEFWIEEAHARGIQLHAWFNPYRANHPSHKGTVSDKSIIKTNPELVVELGTKGYWWMDPSRKGSHQHSLNVVLDVVKRYDIDGVHFDDYFYPYPSYHGKDFPDQESYDAYIEEGGTLERGDWRRDAVNRFIQEVYQKIKEEKPHVEFGISPFGIWKPGHPDEIKGLNQYEELYADAKLWLNEGWVDYFTPQLYWSISSQGQSFPLLLGWWRDQNIPDRHLWPGIIIDDAKSEAKTREILNQVMVTRGMVREDRGACLFSMKWLMQKDYPPAKALRKGPWSKPALIPSSPWLDYTPPDPPSFELISKPDGTLWAHCDDKDSDVFVFLIQSRSKKKWSAPKIKPGKTRKFPIPKEADGVVMRAVDRSRNISEPSFKPVL